jgi:adiponectin receptor
MCIKQILILSLIATYLLLNPKFQGQPSRKFRVCIFISTALLGFAPLAHGINIYGFAQMQRQSGMPYFLAEGLLLIIGALFYTVSIKITYVTR